MLGEGDDAMIKLGLILSLIKISHAPLRLSLIVRINIGFIVTTRWISYFNRIMTETVTIMHTKVRHNLTNVLGTH